MVLELREVVTWLPIAGFAVLLLLAAWIDLRARRIPNWLTGGVVALYPIYLMLGQTPSGWLGALGAALAVLLVGLALFSRGAIGGGDVKLIAGVTLWAGLEHLALFALVTSLAGGGLALLSIGYQRWHFLVDAHLAGLGWKPASAPSVPRGLGSSECAGGGQDRGAPSAVHEGASLPYGIAIAAGGLAVIAQLLNL